MSMMKELYNLIEDIESYFEYFKEGVDEVRKQINDSYDEVKQQYPTNKKFQNAYWKLIEYTEKELRNINQKADDNLSGIIDSIHKQIKEEQR